jgi:DNA polymerase III subunit beta
VAARDTPVRPTFIPGQVILTAGSADEADGTYTVACELDGDPVIIAFHPRRLLDAVTATGTGRARIALTTPAKPAVFTPAGDDRDGGGAGLGYRHLLMPIRSAG